MLDTASTTLGKNQPAQARVLWKSAHRELESVGAIQQHKQQLEALDQQITRREDLERGNGDAAFNTAQTMVEAGDAGKGAEACGVAQQCWLRAGCMEARAAEFEVLRSRCDEMRALTAKAEQTLIKANELFGMACAIRGMECLNLATETFVAAGVHKASSPANKIEQIDKLHAWAEKQIQEQSATTQV